MFLVSLLQSTLLDNESRLCNDEDEFTAHSAGVEPAARNLEGCCSILSELRMPTPFQKKSVLIIL